MGTRRFAPSFSTEADSGAGSVLTQHSQRPSLTSQTDMRDPHVSDPLTKLIMLVNLTGFS